MCAQNLSPMVMAADATLFITRRFSYHSKHDLTFPYTRGSQNRTGNEMHDFFFNHRRRQLSCFELEHEMEICLFAYN